MQSVIHPETFRFHCGTPGLDQRHRVVDAIADRLDAGEPADEVAADYDLLLEAMAVVAQWRQRWGS